MDENIKKIRQITWLSVMANVLLTAGKIIFGIIAHSQALVADGVHSLSDFVTDGAIILGSKYWSKAPDEEHPYGHGRIETMVTIGIAVILASAAVGIAIEAVKTMGEQTTHIPGWSVLVVSFISVVIKEILFRLTRKIGEKANSRALIANAWHHRTDAISSIPVFIAVGIIRFLPQYYFLDNIAAIIVALLLIKTAWDIVKPSLEELMESQIHFDITASLNDIEKSYPEIHEFHKIRIRRVGNAHYVDLHMLTDGNITIAQAHVITDYIRKDLMEVHDDLGDITIHVEPVESQKTVNDDI